MKALIKDAAYTPQQQTCRRYTKLSFLTLAISPLDILRARFKFNSLVIFGYLWLSLKIFLKIEISLREQLLRKNSKT